MSYTSAESAIPASLDDVEYAAEDVFKYYIKEDGVAFSDRVNISEAVWNIDTTNSANIATNWWLSLTRSSPGVADITTGAERNARYMYKISSILPT